MSEQVRIEVLQKSPCVLPSKNKQDGLRTWRYAAILISTRCLLLVVVHPRVNFHTRDAISISSMEIHVNTGIFKMSG